MLAVMNALETVETTGRSCPWIAGRKGCLADLRDEIERARTRHKRRTGLLRVSRGNGRPSLWRLAETGTRKGWSFRTIT